MTSPATPASPALNPDLAALRRDVSGQPSPRAQLARAAVLLTLALTGLAGCAEKTVALSILTYNHADIGCVDVSVSGAMAPGGSSVYPGEKFGGGAKTTCCIDVPADLRSALWKKHRDKEPATDIKVEFKNWEEVASDNLEAIKENTPLTGRLTEFRDTGAAVTTAYD